MKHRGTARWTVGPRCSLTQGSRRSAVLHRMQEPRASRSTSTRVPVGDRAPILAIRPRPTVRARPRGLLAQARSPHAKERSFDGRTSARPFRGRLAPVTAARGLQMMAPCESPLQPFLAQHCTSCASLLVYLHLSSPGGRRQRGPLLRLLRVTSSSGDGHCHELSHAVRVARPAVAPHTTRLGRRGARPGRTIARSPSRAAGRPPPSSPYARARSAERVPRSDVRELDLRATCSTVSPQPVRRVRGCATGLVHEDVVGADRYRRRQATR